MGSLALDHVSVTAELEHRPSRPADYELQARILDELGRSLAEQPQQVLQRFTEAIVRHCGVGSAGISLSERVGGVPSFRWVAVSGAWGDKQGSAMPIDASPCGIVVERDAAQLFACPEPHFPAADQKPSIAEVLLVPFGPADEPVGTVWAIAHDLDRRFDREDVRLLSSLSRFASAILWTTGSLEAAIAANETAGRAAERDAAERASHETSEKLHLAMEAGGQASWELDLTTMALDASDDLRRTCRQGDGARFCYDDLLNAVHPDDRAGVEAAVKGSIGSGRTANIEFRTIGPDGTVRWIHIRAKPYFAGDGKPLRMLGISSDVTARKETEKRQNLLLRLSDALRPLGDPVEIIAVVSEILGRELGAGQVGYAEADTTGDHVTIDREWNDGTIPTNAHRHRLSEFGPAFIADLKRGTTIAIADVSRDPRTASPEALARFGRASIGGFLNVPLVKKGRLVAVLAVHSRTPRNWSASEILLVEDVAERTWASVERARSELASRESEERFRSFADNSADTLWIVDAETRQIEYLSPAFEAMWGEEREKVTADLGRWAELVHPADRERAMEAMPIVLAGETYQQTYRIVRPRDGAVRHIQDTGFPIRDRKGAIRRVAGIAQDVTEQEESRRRLAESEGRQRVLIEGIPQLVWRAGNAGAWTWSSPQWAETTQQVEADSLGDRWMEAVHPDDRPAVEEAWARAAAAGEYHVEHRLRIPSKGRYRWFQSRAVPLRDEQGAILEWLGTSTDVDELRELQERQKVLVNELQHRTRNLMGVVKATATKTLRTSADLASFEPRFQSRIDALARVQGLLSKRGENDRVTFDELVRGELQAMSGTEDRITLDGPAGVRLRSSTVQIVALALHELATNAVKYGALGQPGAHLTVTWRLHRDVDVDHPLLHVDWRETGVIMDNVDPSHCGTGQGRELLERALPYQVKARTCFSLGPDGVHCSIVMPVSTSNLESLIHA